MNLDGALQTFFAEAEELLASMESALLRVDDGAHDAETLNEIFRAAHTIKGSAGLFGLHAIVGFTHIVENLLDQVRSGTMSIDSDLLSLLLNCRDHMANLVRDVMNHEEPDADRVRRGEQLQQQLMQRLGVSETEPTAATEDADTDASAHGAPGTWHLSLRLGPDTLRNGMDPL
ncbi:MAG TPA: Hpt domain-containing protein, partial [Dongiaceae bacterium]|nr:Hpt domain-containing protein [Dongiaceae bacterium]